MKCESVVVFTDGLFALAVSDIFTWFKIIGQFWRHDVNNISNIIKLV